MPVWAAAETHVPDNAGTKARVEVEHGRLGRQRCDRPCYTSLTCTNCFLRQARRMMQDQDSAAFTDRHAPPHRRRRRWPALAWMLSLGLFAAHSAEAAPLDGVHQPSYRSTCAQCKNETSWGALSHHRQRQRQLSWPVSDAQVAQSAAWPQEPLERRQTWGTDTVYTTSTTTVFMQPSGVTPITTVTQIATVTAPNGAVPTPSGQNIGDLVVVTETETATIVVTEPTEWTYTNIARTTITVEATRTIGGAEPAWTPNEDPQGRGDAQQAIQTGIPFDYTCRPGDQNEKYPGGMSIEATDNQRPVLYLLGIYIVAILVAWNLIGFRTILFPVKMLVVAYHEFWHILVGVCMAQKMHSVSLAPDTGGRTIFSIEEANLDPRFPLQPYACYFAAMVGNALIGALLVFCGFNTLASKIASFFVGLSYAAILWHAGSGVGTLVLITLWIGLMVGFWFINHALYLKYYILFIGVMTVLYFIWDIMDDLVFRKEVPCCPKQLEYRFRTDAGPRFTAGLWGGVWAGISILLFVSFVLLAVAVFRQTPHGEYCQGQTFLPT